MHVKYYGYPTGSSAEPENYDYGNIDPEDAKYGDPPEQRSHGGVVGGPPLFTWAPTAEEDSEREPDGASEEPPYEPTADDDGIDHDAHVLMGAPQTRILAADRSSRTVRFAVKVGVRNASAGRIGLEVHIQGLDKDEFELLSVRLAGQVAAGETRTLTASGSADHRMYQEVSEWRVNSWAAT